MTKRGKMNGGSLHLILMCGQVFYVMLGDREFRNPLFKHLSLPRVGEIRQDKQFLNLTLNIAWKFPPKIVNVSIFAALLVLPRQSELVSARGHSQLLFGSKFIWGQCQMLWPGLGPGETIHHRLESAPGREGGGQRSGQSQQIVPAPASRPWHPLPEEKKHWGFDEILIQHRFDQVALIEF